MGSYGIEVVVVVMGVEAMGGGGGKETYAYGAT